MDWCCRQPSAARVRQKRSRLRSGWLLGLLSLVLLAACGQPTASTTLPTLVPQRPTPAPLDPSQLDDALADVQRSVSNNIDSATAFGFASQEEVDAATVGRPARMYLLAPPVIRSYRPGQRIADLIVDEQEWAVPILVDGDLRPLAFVRENGQRGMSSATSTVLPPEYDDPNVTVSFLITRQVGVDLILLEENGQERLAVAQNPRFYEELNVLGHESYPPEELMPALKQAVRQKCGWLFRRC